ncbi:MAG: tetratricopeptide repeat protein [Deltaproteobacteria bacterium]|jgi:tetratricopeptide (TPR) repeat protein|nr:tetratricopeptide repeat protein [Deltaproteobacteria bacterium]
MPTGGGGSLAFAIAAQAGPVAAAAAAVAAAASNAGGHAARPRPESAPGDGSLAFRPPAALVAALAAAQARRDSAQPSTPAGTAADTPEAGAAPPEPLEGRIHRDAAADRVAGDGTPAAPEAGDAEAPGVRPSRRRAAFPEKPFSAFFAELRSLGRKTPLPPPPPEAAFYGDEEEREADLKRAELTVAQADTYAGKGELRTARRLYGDALEILTDAAGPFADETRQARIGLARLHEQLDMLEAASDLFGEEARESERLHGSRDPGTLMLVRRYAWCLSLRARRPEGAFFAEAAGCLFADTAAAAGACLGPLHRETLSAKLDLAAFHVERGRPLRALAVLEGPVAALAAADPGDPRLTSLRIGLGETLSLLGEHADAREHLEKALEGTQGCGAEGSWLEAAAEMGICRAAAGMGEFLEAWRHGLRALEIRREDTGAESPEAMEAKDLLAGILELDGNATDARMLVAELLNRREYSLGRGHPETEATRERLSRLLEARKARGRAGERYEPATTREPPEAAVRLCAEAEEAAYAGDFRRALAIFLAARDMFAESMGPAHPLTRKYAETAAMCHDLLDEPDRARELRAVALAAAERALGPRHPAALDAAEALAVSLNRLGKHRAARDILSRTLFLRRATLGPTHPLARRTSALLARPGGTGSRPAPGSPPAGAAQEGPPQPPGTAAATGVGGAEGLPPALASAAADIRRAAGLAARGFRLAARPLFEGGLATLGSWPGECREERLMARLGLAGIMEAMGEEEEAAAAIGAELAEAAGRLGSLHDLSLGLAGRLAWNHCLRGRAEAARELLDGLPQAAAAAAGGAGDCPSPRGLARLLRDVATVSLAGGDAASARGWLAKSLAIASARLGPEDPDTLDILARLGDAELACGNRNLAAACYSGALSLCRKAGGARPEAEASARSGLARLAEAAEATAPAGEGPAAREGAGTGADGAPAAPAAGGAVALRREALAAHEAALGPGSESACRERDALAALLEVNGGIAEARSLLAVTHAARVRDLGPSHPLAAEARFRMALASAGPGEAAARELDRLAGELEGAGDFRAARGLRERSWAARDRALGPCHPDTVRSADALAACLAALAHEGAPGAAAAAVFLRCRADAGRRKAPPLLRKVGAGPPWPPPPVLLLPAGGPGTAAAPAAPGAPPAAPPAPPGCPAAALPLRRRLFRDGGQPAEDFPDSPEALAALSLCLDLLGDAYGARTLRSRLLAEPERHRRHGEDGVPVPPGGGREGAEGRARAPETGGDPVAARELRRRILLDRSRALGERHPSTADAIVDLAGSHAAEGDLQGARDLLYRAVSARDAALNPWHPAALEARVRLAAVLSALGEHSRAGNQLDMARTAIVRDRGESVPEAIFLKLAIAAAAFGAGDRLLGFTLSADAAAESERLLGRAHLATAAGKALTGTVWSRPRGPRVPRRLQAGAGPPDGAEDAGSGPSAGTS